MKLLHGNCLEELRDFDDDSIDLVFTSPPYADRRKKLANITGDKYVDWFLPIGTEIKRVLKPTGSFFLNIKPHTDKGERHLYVFDLICQLKREVGLMFVEEYCWTKGSFPGSFPGRFKNAFEPVYHFTKDKPGKITFNPLACGTPIKPESMARAYRKACGAPKSGSGMTGQNNNFANIKNKKLARPTNVINANNIVNQFSDKQIHPAVFPEKLVEFFVLSFSNKGDVILDPFMGSGTTGIVCKRFDRDFIGIDIHKEYVELAEKCINKVS